MARIIFMGTPEFSVPILAALIETQNEIVGVFTRADKPAGRGKQLQASPIKQLAQKNNLPIFQPRTLRNPEIIAIVRDLKPDLIVVAAYGLILPREILAIPPRGCVNTHASLLPRHRGASPISAAILADDAETGITLMQMDEGVDTGAILAQREIPIADDDTTATLTEKLSRLAADLLTNSLTHILSHSLTPTPQDNSRATLAPMLKKEQGLIDWTQSAEQIARRVRAFNPWPSAYTFFNGAQLKIHRARAVNANVHAKVGQAVKLQEEIAVVCGEGALVLEEVQLAGKRAMSAEEFVRGQREFVNSLLGGMAN
ncbi:MAG: methionyl-tRNA formyltransferase [Chloroflexi bacterium]|nr:methionyl-tRNA formyltransferase [Chloroflexota bacterium]